MYSFKSWVHRRQDMGDLMPQADKVVPLVAGAGTAGMTRQQLGHAIDRDVLNGLIDGLLRAGQLSLSWEGGVPVYRTLQQIP